MSYYAKYVWLMGMIFFIHGSIHSMDYDYVPFAEGEPVLVKHMALLLVSKKQCCGASAGYPQCVPGAQSCISQAIRAKYCS